MKRTRTPWTQEQKEDFKGWHTDLLKRLCYPDEVRKELSRACDKWLSKVPGGAKC